MTDIYQNIPFFAPKQCLAIGSKILEQSILDFSFSGGRNRANIGTVVVADPLRLFGDLFVKGALCSFGWGYVGYAYMPLNIGMICEDPTYDGSAWEITCANFGILLTQPKIITALEEQSPTEIVKNWIVNLGFPEANIAIADSDLILDKLPLYQVTIAEAIKIISNRLSLNWEWWFDLNGGFHCGAPDYSIDPLARYVYGRSILDFQKDGDEYVLSLVRTHIDHSCVLEVVDQNAETFRYWVDRFKHTANGTTIYLRKLV